MGTAHQVVCFGEVLWDLLPSGARPGGAPMNVAYHLQKLGMSPALISRVGRDERGRQVVAILREHGVPVEWVQEDGQRPTGVVHAAIGANHEVSYDIVEGVAWDFIGWDQQLSDLVHEAPFFVFGSLACRTAPSRNTLFRLIEAARCRVADINLRAPHYTRIVVEALLHNTEILKLNEHELPVVAGWYRDLSSPEEQVRLVQDVFQIPTIVVTKGGEGALLNKDGVLTAHRGYRVPVEDTVGSGDAFLAGFLHGVQQGLGAEECLRFANGMGAFMATKSGACPVYEVWEVRELVKEREVV